MLPRVCAVPGSPNLPVPEDDEGQFAEGQLGGDVRPKSSGEVLVRGPAVVADCLLLNWGGKKVVSAGGCQLGGNGAVPRHDAVPTEGVTAQLAALAVWLLGEGTEDAPHHLPAQGSGDR